MRLVDAWRHGVPQHRQRLILVAPRTGCSSGRRRPTRSRCVRRSGTFRRWGTGPANGRRKYGGPRTAFQHLAADRCARRCYHDHVTRPVRSDDRKRSSSWPRDAVPGPARAAEALPRRHLRRQVQAARLGEVADDHGAHREGRLLVHPPRENRTLTVREAARSRPSRIASVRRHPQPAFGQIGNAVPPALAGAVAAGLIDAGDRPTPPLEHRASAVRRRRRELVTAWAADQDNLPWADTGQPWAVLVGTLCGGHPLAGHRPIPQRVPVLSGSKQLRSAPAVLDHPSDGQSGTTKLAKLVGLGAPDLQQENPGNGSEDPSYGRGGPVACITRSRLEADEFSVWSASPEPVSVPGRLQRGRRSDRPRGCPDRRPAGGCCAGNRSARHGPPPSAASAGWATDDLIRSRDSPADRPGRQNLFDDPEPGQRPSSAWPLHSLRRTAPPPVPTSPPAASTAMSDLDDTGHASRGRHPATSTPAGTQTPVAFGAPSTTAVAATFSLRSPTMTTTTSGVGARP